MGRGSDLADEENALVHDKIMQNWDFELRQIKSGGRKRILKACVEGSVRVCERKVNNSLGWLEVLTSFSRMGLALILPTSS